MVAVANDGLDGFNKAVADPPDLVVLDYQMPVWDGLKTLKEFRAHPKLNGIPVLMLTGDATRDSVMAAISGGVNDYVLKDTLTKELLLNKIARLLRDFQAAKEPAPPPMVRRPNSPASHLSPAHQQEREQDASLQSLINWE